MRKILVATFLILLATTVVLAYELPYCACTDMYYNPQGPNIPTFFGAEQVSGIRNGVYGHLVSLDIDIGNLPYSVPDYGWYSKPEGSTENIVANVYSTALGMNIKLEHMLCCGTVVYPVDPLYMGSGVSLEWNHYNNIYIGVSGGNMYVAMPFNEAGTAYITLFEVMYGTNGQVFAFVVYEIVIPPMPVMRKPITFEVE